MNVAILGGGPSGAFAAERLATAGVRVTLIDEKLAWEKPCGGGLTFKAYSQYPFLLETGAPKKLVRQSVLSAPGAGSTALTLRDPLVIYSRFELNQMLLRRAEAAGARIEKVHVSGVDRSASGWKVRTKSGAMPADFCLVATGARNALRNMGASLTSADTMSALGYFVPGTRDRIDIEFLPNLAGYIWVFPRQDHLSVGICGKGLAASELRRKLERYMDEKEIRRDEATFYSHVLPCLDTPAWTRAQVAGDGWISVGDAAGLVDPVTGEGLYYALRSADLAAQSLLAGDPCGAGDAYRSRLREELTSDLERASRMANRIFHGSFLFGSIPARMLQMTRRSESFRGILQDLFSGTQSCIGLKPRVLREARATLFEILASFGPGRAIPRKDIVI